ncbi:methyltransferase [Gordonia sinesedis]
MRGTTIARLRAAGCVFADEEAEILLSAATTPADLDAMCRRRESGEPLEHIVGWAGFGELRLAVGPGVFVPRQRSLLLARAAVAAAREHSEPVVLEAFCGVAPIGATIRATVPGAAVHVADRDATALSYARRNVGTRVEVHHGDGFGALPARLRRRVTVITAVPPYVPEAAHGLLPHEAVDHEPPAALFAGADGLDRIVELVHGAGDWLADAGVLLIEMTAAQAETMTTSASPSTAGRPGDTGRWWVPAGCVEHDDGRTVVAAFTRPGDHRRSGPAR